MKNKKIRNIEVVGIGNESEAEKVKEAMFEVMPQLTDLLDRPPYVKRKKYYVPKK